MILVPAFPISARKFNFDFGMGYTFPEESRGKGTVCTMKRIGLLQWKDVGSV